jgi:hypothetical protein
VTADDALAFVQKHGVVLASGKGPVPRMAEAIVNGPIRGSWWAHPDGRRIFAIFQILENSADILVCRLVDNKVTFVHRRLWPALIRAAGSFSAAQLAQTHQQHTAAGHHVRRDIAFPDWVPPEVLVQARMLSEPEALAALGDWALVRDAKAPKPEALD